MKKLLAVLVVLAMFGICSSSYGDYILVYNVSSSVTGIDMNNSNLPVKVSLKGYLVERFDAGVLQDANLILYGKDADKGKVYVELNRSDSNGFIDVYVDNRGAYSFTEFDGDAPFDFDGLVYGKKKAVDIGFGKYEKVEVANSKGTVIVGGEYITGGAFSILLDPDQKIRGTGNVSATLWTAGTKWANGDNDEEEQKTQDQAVAKAREILEGKGYENVNL